MVPKRNWALKARIVERYGSQVNFSPVVKMHPTKLNMIINGHRPASPEDAKSIAQALGTDVRELFA
jgi:DNA-binding transcriptional regulator YdaS (Cro superfamily)